MPSDGQASNRSATQRYGVAIDVEAIRTAIDQRLVQPIEASVTAASCGHDDVASPLEEAAINPPGLEPGIPKLSTFYIYMTEGCNLGCRHCWISPSFMMNKGTGGHVPADRLLAACREAIPLGLSSVKLTGGEPLLHPDFEELVYGLRELGILVWMESNLTLQTPTKAVAILDTMPLLSTSLDAATAEGHDRFRGAAGSFAATCGALELLGPHTNVQVIMSVHSGNVHEIDAVVELAAGLGAGSVKFNLIHSTGRADRMTASGGTLDVAELIQLGRWVEEDLRSKHNIKLFWSAPPAFDSLARLAATGRGEMCGIHNILGVLGSGHYALCGIGQTVDDLVYGSVGEDLHDLWNKHPTLTRLRTELPDQLEGVCSICIHKRVCKAHCVANNYHENTSLKSSHWFCEEAYRQGLFPQSRLALPGPSASPKSGVPQMVLRQNS